MAVTLTPLLTGASPTLRRSIRKTKKRRLDPDTAEIRKVTVKAPIKKKSRAGMASASSSKSDMDTNAAEQEQPKGTPPNDIVKLIKGVDLSLIHI